MKALEPKTPWTDMLASSSAHEERFDRTLGLGRQPFEGSRGSSELAGQRCGPEDTAMANSVAAAAALHLLPASMATGVPPLTGLASGSLGLTRADIKLLADSDSDSEEEEQPSGCPAPPPAPSPAPLRQPIKQLDPGPVYKYKWEALRELDEHTLRREAWALDQPGVYCPSFRRLKKKTSVPAVKKLGRALKEFGATGSIRGGLETAKELYSAVVRGEGKGPGFRPLSSRQCSRALHSAARTSLRRLCQTFSKESAAEQNEVLNRLKAGLKDAQGTSAPGLLLAAAQSQMYHVSGRLVRRKAVPTGQEFKSGSEELAVVAPGVLATVWLRLHEEPEVDEGGVGGFLKHWR